MASNSKEVKIANGKEEIVRNLAKFGPDIWGDLFTSFVLDNELMETCNSEVDVLKDQVRAMLVAAVAEGATCAAIETDRMTLIDAIERLGLSYHFENEIEKQVQQMLLDYNDNNISKQEGYDNLSTVSLHFRIFRQHGHKLSTDVFKKFTDENGKYLESLSSDIEGMLSLYEAANLRVHGEDILEEALSFSIKHLNKSVDDKLIENLLVVEQVKHALLEPLQRGMQRLQVRQYISFYQQHASKNDTLLELAKLDFNRLQLLYKQELCNIIRWWKDLLLESEVSHVRDRAVEAYFWCGSAFDAPEYFLSRAMLTKHFLILTILDDTYDAYATYEEIQPFTHAWQKWDMSVVDVLPDYMKPIYKSILNAYTEIGEDLDREGTSFGARYVIDSVKLITKCYSVEALWLKEKYIPAFDEYLANELLATTNTLHAAAMVGMREHATIEAFDWIATNPKIVLASMLISKLLNDIAGYKHEHERKHIPTAIDCYMKQYSVSKDEAIEDLYKMVESAWQDINEEMLKPTAVSRPLLIAILNIIRNANSIYRPGGDGFTESERIKHQIESLYVHPILM